MSWLLLYLTIGWIIRIAMFLVVLRRTMAPGAAMAWLGVVFLHPYIGATLYALVGEARLGTSRVRRHRQLVEHFRHRKFEAQPNPRAIPGQIDPTLHPLVLQAQKIGGMPVLGGNTVEFLSECPQLIDRLSADIAAAQSRVDLLYYIIACDSSGQSIARALIAAAARGVKCRVLADAVASRAFFHSQMMRQLKDAGVSISEALPVNPFQRGLPRMDLRNHRKLAIIDGRIAFAGSHNLVNADYGGRHGGPWVDLTARFTGPIVDEFAIVFAEDWSFGTNEIAEIPTPQLPPQLGSVQMQVVPTGPTAPGESFRRLLLGAIESARNKMILTTPYFVPDEPTLVAMQMAADRGVEVNLILPQRGDHFFTAAAGRAHFTRLLQSGISIHLFHPGLIHAKTATVDDAFALVGSANLDVRSFNLNFELTSIVYGKEATNQLRAIQTTYLSHSEKLDSKKWVHRPVIGQYADAAVSLLSPLL